MTSKILFLLFALLTIPAALSVAVTSGVKNTATASDGSAQKEAQKLRTRRAHGKADALENTGYTVYESLDALDPEYVDDIEHFDEEALDDVAHYSSKEKRSRRRRLERTRRPGRTHRRRKSRNGPKKKNTSKRKKRRKGRSRKELKSLPKGHSRSRRRRVRGRKRRNRRRLRRGKRKPYYSTTRPATTRPPSTTRPRSTQPTNPTGYVSGQNDKYPPQCKCRRLPNKGGLCFDMKKSGHIRQCKRRDCDRSYECVIGDGRGLKNCYRRYAFEEVRVVYSYNGMHRCKRVKFKIPKVFYSPYY